MGSPRMEPQADRYGAMVSMPVVFLSWMIVGIIVTLPTLSQWRGSLVLIALLPAGAAAWSRRQEAGGVVRLLVAGLIWGMVAVWMPGGAQPDRPPEGRPKLGIQAVVADREDRGDSVMLTLDEVTSEAWNPAGQVRVSVYRQSVDALPGDRVAMTVRPRALTGARNPGAFDYRTYQLQNGVVATATASGPVERIGVTDRWYWNRLRQKLTLWFAEVLPPSQLGLSEALLLGKRGHLDNELQQALFVSGTFHLVAISGLHLSLVGGAVYYFLRLLLTLVWPLSRRWDMKRPAALLALFPVTAYGYLAGWSVSTQRAWIMVVLFLVAVVLQRQRESWRLLTFSALLILSWQPGELLNAGFQLSFLCVAVILYLLDRFPMKGWRGQVVLTGLSTVAIGVVTAPVSQWAFHRLSPYGMVVNPLAIPWVGELSTPLGLVAMVLHPVWPEGADWLLKAMGWTLDIYRWLVERSVEWPGADQRAAGPVLPGMALFVAAGMVAAGLGRSGRWGWRRIGMTLVALLGLAWPRESIPESQLRLIVLDVGQALAMVAKLPGGGWSVFDAGGSVTARFNVGEAVVSTALWHFGVERLERVVISHPQRDHMAGMAQVVRNFPVGSVWISTLSEQDEERSDVRELFQVAAARGVPVRRFENLEIFREGAATLRVLPPMPIRGRTGANDRSLAVEIEHGEQRILLTGDMETREESWLIKQGVLRPVAVLLAPHHGSKTSSSPAFVQTVRPEHVVFSVGLDNQWGFPRNEVVGRWVAVGARPWRTDYQGAIEVISDGRRLTITTAE
ncbi:MAG: DNA internalization-related competence protein ComEC/Rec2 [Magnetococcales bacterium]|nr:DNA internalization-related competence protein ComEC/Rec2 [Magnetococcales bacterium]